MGKPYRFIIVGTGGMGNFWCRTFMSRLQEMGKARAVAAVDINPDALVNAREGLGLPPEKCYTDMKKAFDENKADFAIIVTPPAFHEAVVDLALKHDMDILSEKPITDTIESSCRVYKKVKAAGKKMAVTLSHRFDQDKQSLEREIKSGNYGDLNYCVCRFTHNCRAFGSWGKFRHEIPDPLLIEGSVHHFDIFRALSGSDAKTVYTLSWNPRWGEFAGDSTAFVTIDMMNGVKCLYEGAKANACTYNGWGNEYFRAECEHGTLELDRRWLRALRDNGWNRPFAQDLPLADQPAWANAWISEMFCDWLDGGAPPPCHLDDEIQCAALLFAAIESAHTGKPVDVQEFLKKYLAAV
ncbi:MAG: Gfo/Idh/MocA family oxidoreductase [bacterium]